MTDETDPRKLLEQERQRFSDFLKATSEWSWETDAQNRFTYMSPNVQEITGVPPEWHYGKTREDMGIRDEMSEADWSAFQQKLENRLPFRNLTFARRGPTAVSWIQTSGVPFYDNGTFQGYRGSGRIVTEEVEVARMASRLTAAVENMGDYFSLWDDQDRLLFSNRKFLPETSTRPDLCPPGITFSEHIRMIYEFLDCSDDPETREKNLSERLNHHKNPIAPLEFKRNDGLTVLVNEHKLPGGLTATISTNITHLKTIEKDIADKAEIVETAFKTIPDGIIVLGPDRLPATWNDYLFSIFDITEIQDAPEEDLRHSLMTVLTSKIESVMVEPEAVNLSSLLLDPRETSQQEFRLPGNKWVEFRGSPMMGGGYLMTFRDFTERKELDRLKSQFVSTVSHELRTPLTSILGSLGLVKGGASGDIPKAARELIQVGIDNGERLLNLINDILDLEKISQDDFELELQILSITELVEASVKANLGFAERYQVGLVPKLAEPSLTVAGDRHRLMQVMDNLLSNAIKFSSASDEVEIMVTARGPRVRVSVTDRGPGVPKRFQKSIFDRFVQVDSSDTRSIAGTGLGLNISKNIVLKHGGVINLHSTPSVGSTFYFELPLFTDSAD